MNTGEASANQKQKTLNKGKQLKYFQNREINALL